MNKADEIEYMVASREITAAAHQIELDALRAEIEQLKNPWISVEEAYPDDDSGYQVFVIANDIISQSVDMIHYNGNSWMRDGSEYPPIVTHWMPIPKLEGEG